MHTIWNRLQKSTTRGVWLPLVAMLAIGLFATAANAVAPPPIVITQANFYTAFPPSSTISPYGNGVIAGGEAAGTSWGMNSKGMLVASTSYGNLIVEFNTSTKTMSVISPAATGVANPGGVAIDSNNYLYLGFQYSNTIAKYPMNSDGTYTISVDPTASGSNLPACTGATSDTVACVLSPLSKESFGYFGVASLTFDSSGDLFFVTDNQNGPGAPGYSIYECPNSCLYGATPTAPIAIYSEPAGTKVNQLYAGSIAVDASGNVFFTDSDITSDSNNTSAASYVKEIPYTSGTGYASSPTTLATLTIASPSGYDDEIDAVYVDASGDVYFAAANSGTYEIVNSGGTLNTANPVAISSQGAKLMMPDGKGNFYIADYSGTLGGDSFGFIGIGGTVTFPGTTSEGSPATQTVSATDNSEACANAVLTFAATENGSPTTDFTGAAGTCATPDFGGTSAFVPVTITFSPTATGTIAGTFTATDSTSGSSGTVNLSALAGPPLIAQSVTMTFSPTLPAPVSPATTPSVGVGAGPWTITATGGGSGNPVVLTLDGTTTSGIATLTAGSTSGTYTLAVTGAGTVVVDANQLGNSTYAAAPQVQQSITVTSTTSPITGNTGVTGDMVVNTQTWGAIIQNGGGMWGSDSAAGTSGGVNSMGTVVVGDSYGGYVEQFPAGSATSSTATSTNLGKGDSLGIVTFIDSQGYLWLAGGNLDYSTGGLVVKEPMQADGTYATWSKALNTVATSLPACAGDGQAPDNAGMCLISPLTNVPSLGEFGIGAIYVDAAGSLYFATNDKVWNGLSSYPPTAPYSSFQVIKCSASCLYGASPTAPVQLFQEPGTNYNTSAVPPDYSGSFETYVGAVAADPSGNVFFTDSEFSEVGKSTEYSLQSNVWEIPVDTNSSTGYATTPVLLETESPACGTPPCNYNTDLDSLATDSAGNVYFADQYTGIFEIANQNGTLDAANPVALANRGSKLMIPDGKGNFYYFAYNGGDEMGFVAVGNGVNVTPETGPGTPVSTSALSACAPSSGSAATGLSCVYVVDNAASCTDSPTPTFTFPDSQFTATTVLTNTSGATPTSTCGTFEIGNASSFPVTVTFDPLATSSGAVQETGQINDPINGGTGSVVANGLAEQAQVISGFAGISSPVSYGGGPYTLSATGGASGNPVVFTIDSATTQVSGTPIAAVSGTNGTTLTITGVGTVVIDINQAGGTASGQTYAAALQVQETITVTQATQTITFAPPATVPVGSAAITLTATASSGLPVTFSLNTSATTSAGASLAGSVLTIGGTGAIVIDANQAGNSDYTAATQVEKTIQVVLAGTVANPTFTPASGGTLYVNSTTQNSFSIADTTSGAQIYYTVDGSTPSPGQGTTTLYSGPVAITSTAVSPLVVNAIAVETGYNPSAVETASYTISTIPPNFTATANPPAVDLYPGSSAIIDITVAPNASFANTPVTFACSGAPAGVSCAFSPSTVTPAAGKNISTVLTVTDAASTSSALRHGPNPFIPGGATFALALCFFGWKRRRGLMLLLVLAAGVFGLTQLTGCGSSGNSASGSTSSTMTVTATGGGITQTIPVTITVRK